MNLCVILPRALTKTKLKKTAAQDCVVVFMTKLLISKKLHFSCLTTLYTVSSVRGLKRMCNTSLAALLSKSKMAARGPQNDGRVLERCLPLGFWRSKQLLLNKFFGPSTPSMRKVDNGEEKNGGETKNKIK